ncbi:hypothetical protein G4H71_16570 [Rhodococcus triatomae]|nr:hypothetical protein [Rhodococcus triatomae]QNG19654.1 hypothetical protein G4H72_13805 [Rhodococcus triatomae]QNG24431.1 hypothetical protein G4H71_16570 [Rhodococcus triatomae]
MTYAPGDTSRLVIPEELGGLRTFFLIHDPTSPHEAEIATPPIPHGGTLRINPDGTASILDAHGTETDRMAAPWANDTHGNPVPTHYIVRNGKLIQQVHADHNTAYPILADPPEEEICAVPYDDTQRAEDEEMANFIGPGTPTFEAERAAAQARLADNELANTHGPMTAEGEAERAAAQDRQDGYGGDYNGYAGLPPEQGGYPEPEYTTPGNTGKESSSDPADLLISMNPDGTPKDPSRISTPGGDVTSGDEPMITAIPYGDTALARDQAIVATEGPLSPEGELERIAAQARLDDHALAHIQGPLPAELAQARADAQARQAGYSGRDAEFNGYVGLSPLDGGYPGPEGYLGPDKTGEAAVKSALNALNATELAAQAGANAQHTQGPRAAFTPGQDFTPTQTQALRRITERLGPANLVISIGTAAHDVRYGGKGIPEAAGGAGGGVVGAGYGATTGMAFGMMAGGPVGAAIGAGVGALVGGYLGSRSGEDAAGNLRYLWNDTTKGK